MAETPLLASVNSKLQKNVTIEKQDSSSSMSSDKSIETPRTKIKKLKNNPSLSIKDRQGKLLKNDLEKVKGEGHYKPDTTDYAAISRVATSKAATGPISKELLMTQTRAVIQKFNEFVKTTQI